MQTKKLSVALRNIEAARVALEKEQKRLRKYGTKKAQQQAERLLAQLDATEIQLLSIREEVKLAERVARYRERSRHPERALKETKKRTHKAPKGKKSPRPRSRTEQSEKPEQLIGQRELSIRGFWDRYPKEEQTRYPKRFKQFPAKFRRGPTAYDLLLQDYLSFTPSQRKHLQIRVAYGVIHESGKIIDGRLVEKMGLKINLSMDRGEAMLALRTILTRSGLIYVPIGWDNLDEDASIPLGIEWWLVND